MTSKSTTKEIARFRALRDVALPDRAVAPGELVDLDADTAALLIRDGMVVPEEGA